MSGDTAVKCSVCGKFDVLRDEVYYHRCGDTPSKTPHKCPACDGWGKRRQVAGGVKLTCPACNGKGVVWEP